NRAEPLFVRGEGAWLYSDSGEAWLDCVSGIASNALGHAHPALRAALESQADKLWHVSNMFRIEGQERLAAKLAALSFADRVFFTNSGAEAVECALKLARRHHHAKGAHDRTMIYSLRGAFHGRTYATINAAGNPAYIEGFGPALPGYGTIDVTDRSALCAALADPETAAVIVEPVQGEGGARALPFEILRWLRRECTRRGVLLIYDEVQCGMGRTGRLFAHQWYRGCEPDVMAIAKALGGGFPVGACLASEAAAAGMVPGTHGSTFGGNPLAMAVAETALDIIADRAFLDIVEASAAALRDGLGTLAARYPAVIRDVRGKGMLVGVALHPTNREFMAAARAQHLLVAAGGDNIVRLLPPLNISEREVTEIVTRFGATCAAMSMAEAS
ncbi:MAG: aspartate aminotransferase family protein, partial [Tsuneonella sp.]